MMRHERTVKRLCTLAAAIALAAALSGLAVAANFMGLRDALLPRKGSVNVVDGDGVVIPGETELTDFISLSGYMDSPESQALAEWQEFLEGYDQDGAILSEVGNGPTGLEERYGQYLVYSREMADKLDEIVEKYGLRLHSAIEVISPEAWPLAAGEFTKENHYKYSGYIYEDGTFRCDGEAWLDGYGKIDYQFSRSVRGCFNEVTLNAGDVTDFREWGYQTEDGTTVTLGLGSKSRSLILTDLGDSFVLVNVLAGEQADDIFSSGAIGQAELEALADSFVYTALTPVKTPDLEAIRAASDQARAEVDGQPELPAEEPQEVEVPQENEEPQEDEDPLYVRTGITTEAGTEFVLRLAELLEGDGREDIAALLVYPVQVEVSEGTFTVNSPEEFLPYYDETIGQNREGLAADLSWEPAPFADGSGLASAANGAVWFGQVEDGAIRVFTLQTDQWGVRAAEGIGQG